MLHSWPGPKVPEPGAIWALQASVSQIILTQLLPLFLFSLTSHRTATIVQMPTFPNCSQEAEIHPHPTLQEAGEPCIGMRGAQRGPYTSKKGSFSRETREVW